VALRAIERTLTAEHAEHAETACLLGTTSSRRITTPLTTEHTEITEKTRIWVFERFQEVSESNYLHVSSCRRAVVFVVFVVTS
jgi:hypothetical protein